MIMLYTVCILVLWLCVSGVISNYTKTNIWWTFLLGPIGTCIAILMQIRDNQTNVNE